MLKLLKYLPLAAIGKDVGKAWVEDTGTERPKYLSRRFIGSVLALGAGFAAVHCGIKIDADSLATIGDSIEKIITAGIALQGVALTIWGIIDRKKEGEQK